MNNHFNRFGEGEVVEFPSAGYARVDDVEISRSGRTARVSFDVVDANFIDSNQSRARGGRDYRVDSTPDFDRMPLFHLQVVFSTLKSRQLDGLCGYSTCELCFPYRFINYLIPDEFLRKSRSDRYDDGSQGGDYGPSRWFKIVKSSNSAGRLATAYSGLFSKPEKVRVHLQLAAQQQRLSEIFTLPGVRQKQFETADLALFGNAECDHVVVFDVGQGSASASISGNAHAAKVAGTPEIYFDAGAGVYANQKTRPPGLSLEAGGAKAVFLSHWDTDHWAGAMLARPGVDSLLTKTWYAPDQVVGPRHVAFAKNIEANGGRLVLLSPPSLAVQEVPLAGGRVLRWAQGTGRDRNDSGLVAAIECSTPVEQSIILPGDCDYHCFKHLQAKAPVGLLVPHHGARLRSASTDVPAPHTEANDSKLVYSFGPNNKHGKARVRHPTAEAIELHSAWDHGGWRARPGFGAAGRNVRGTSEHSAVARGDVCIDWQR